MFALVFLVLTSFNDREMELNKQITEIDKQILELQAKKRSFKAEIQRQKRYRQLEKIELRKAEDAKRRADSYLKRAEAIRNKSKVGWKPKSKETEVTNIDPNSGIRNKPKGWKIYQEDSKGTPNE
jgi:hypothetical protein